MLSTSRKAFTLVEVMVVSMIFATLAGLVASNFHLAGRVGALSAAADELAARIRQAETMAYANTSQILCSADHYVCKSGSSCDPAYPTNCSAQPVWDYGVIMDTDSSHNKYAIGADYNADGNWVSAETVPGGLVTLPAGIVFQSVTPSAGAAYNANFIFTGSNGSPFSSCPSNCTVTAILKDNVTQRTKTVVLRKVTGLVYVY